MRKKGNYINGEIWVRDEDIGHKVIIILGSDLYYKILEPNPIPEGFEGVIEFDVVRGPRLQTREGIFDEFASPHFPLLKIK